MCILTLQLPSTMLKSMHSISERDSLGVYAKVGYSEAFLWVRLLSYRLCLGKTLMNAPSFEQSLRV